MNGFVWVFIIGMLALAIWGFSQTSKQSKQKITIGKRLQELDGFNPDHTIVKTGLNSLVPMGISVDADAQKLCVIAGEALHVVPFAMVLEAEVVIDGKSVTKTSRGSQAVGAAVGAVVGGGVGAIIGGLSATTSTTQKIKNVFLRLILNDLKYPVHQIELVELTNTGSTPPEIALREAEQWNNILKVVIFQGKASENA